MPKNPESEDEKMSEINARKLGYVVVTDYVKASTGEDVGAALQAIIYNNPQSVIYFPDGEYQTSMTLQTHALGTFSVALELAPNAVIKAHKSWDATSNEAIICLGGGEQKTGEVNTPGSNYYIKGGTIDGSGVADGISIVCGRETSVRELNIINTNVGFHIVRPKTGNGTSSDSDIDKLNIIGNGSESSVGMLIEGWDNTYSNIQISNVKTGVRVNTAANMFRNVRCTISGDMPVASLYEQSVGFSDFGNRNWFVNCTSTNFSTGFLLNSPCSVIEGSKARWTDDFAELGEQIAIRTDDKWNSVAKAVAAEFTAAPEKCYYIASNQGGWGKLIDSVFDADALNPDAYDKNKSYFVTNDLAIQMPSINFEAEGISLFDPEGDYVVVADYVKPDTGEDTADVIQKLVDENPGKTLYFHDGIYLISKTIETSADPAKAVSFRFSNYAQLKAMDSWSEGIKQIKCPEDLAKPDLKASSIKSFSTPLIHIGAKDKDAVSNGERSHCFIEGGILHGSKRADAIWVDGAAVADLRYIAIKFAVVGIYAKDDERVGAANVNVYTVNVIGTGSEDSMGVVLESDSNRLINMRLVAQHISIMVNGSNNFLRNIHPLFASYSCSLEWEYFYNVSVAFYDTGRNNIYDFCYNDQYSVGFYMGTKTVATYDSCFNFWFRGTKDATKPVLKHIGFKAQDEFNSVIRTTISGFAYGKPTADYPIPSECNHLIVGSDKKGSGAIEGVYFVSDNTVKEREKTFEYLLNGTHFER